MAPKRSARLVPRLKVWLQRDGEAVYGDGKHTWLEAIDRAGSLRGAAEELGMSYRNLWGRLRRMEQRLGLALVERRTGGPGGGGMRLTRRGRALVEAYRRFRDELEASLEDRSPAWKRLARTLRPAPGPTPKRRPRRP